MSRAPFTRTQLFHSLTLGLLIAASTGCVMGPTDQVVLNDHETVYGFPIFGFVDPPAQDQDPSFDLALEIYNHVDGGWFPTPVLARPGLPNARNNGGLFEGYGAQWYYWEMTGYIPNWGWTHEGEDHYTAEIRIVRRDGTPLWTFNSTLWEHFNPLQGSLGELWANAGSGKGSITVHARFDDEQAEYRVHPDNR